MLKRFFISVFVVMGTVCGVDAAFTSCGPGYILVESRKKIDGIATAECQKLWCRDLETGKMMGEGDKPNSGYKATAAAVELCDANNNCVECWGERKWCGGEVAGAWNPEYGAYTRGGDNATYQSYQKGGCFAWRLEKPECEDGLSAVLQDDKWICVKEVNKAEAARASTVRRTGAIKRLRR